MPNGGDLGEQEFRTLNAQFSRLDDVMRDFAAQMDAEFILNYHGPERRITFESEDGVVRSLMLSAVKHRRNGHSLESPEFLIAVAAWKDHAGKRRSWHRIIERRSLLPDEGEANDLLVRMYELVNAVSQEDLRADD